MEKKGSEDKGRVREVKGKGRQCDSVRGEKEGESRQGEGKKGEEKEK